ncbi:MAG: DUF1236 domain-containing protein [Hyphomicrobiales bacterium]|nr:DUF1236 domain-containing protein [Hyphomicrobiales bacterium]MBV8827207.1 DUF1236 domain-containing protein [Hyphomicrobiales bacterium]
MTQNRGGQNEHMGQAREERGNARGEERNERMGQNREQRGNARGEERNERMGQRDRDQRMGARDRDQRMGQRDRDQRLGSRDRDRDRSFREGRGDRQFGQRERGVREGRGEFREGRGEFREGRGTVRGGTTTRLSSDQRTQIHERLFAEGGRGHRLGHADFALREGVRIPHSVHLYPLPEDIVTLVPAYRDYEYILVGDSIVIVDPDTYEIVAVIPA